MKRILSGMLCICLLLGCAAMAESMEPSSNGNGLMPYEQVLQLIRWIDDGYARNMTYEEVVAFTGVEGLDKGHRDTSMTALGDHYFDWIAESDPTHFIHVCFRGRDDSGRFEECQWNTSGFKSSEWADADLTEWLTQNASHDTAEVSLEIQRFSFNPLVTVTAQMPTTGWRTRTNNNTAYLYNERGEDNNDPRIEVVTYDDPTMFDFYIAQYENLQPAESRVIAGVEMQGRTYHTIGWDWTEYSAQLSEKVSIAVRISRISCEAGTEGDALLNSLCLSWTEDGTDYSFTGTPDQNGEQPEPQVTAAPVATAEPVPAVTAEPAPVATATPAAEITPAAADGLSAYTGTWYSIWMNTAAMEGDPRTMFGLTMVLTLNADGTGDFDYFGSDGGGTWGTDDDGIVRYWGEGTSLTLLEDGTLCWGSVMSGYTLFSRDQDAKAVVFPADPTAQATEAPVQTLPAQPVTEGTGIVTEEVIGIKYVGKTYMAGGVTMDASILSGEYSIILNADGTAAFTMAGMEVPGYTWKQVEDHIEVDAYGTKLMTLTLQTDGTMLMDYSGAFTLIMEPQVQE